MTQDEQPDMNHETPEALSPANQEQLAAVFALFARIEKSEQRHIAEGLARAMPPAQRTQAVARWRGELAQLEEQRATALATPGSLEELFRLEDPRD
jgi:hypothetical protein